MGTGQKSSTTSSPAHGWVVKRTKIPHASQDGKFVADVIVSPRPYQAKSSAEFFMEMYQHENPTHITYLTQV